MNSTPCVREVRVVHCSQSRLARIIFIYVPRIEAEYGAVIYDLILLKQKDVIFVDFEVKKQLEAARRILEDLRESL